MEHVFAFSPEWHIIIIDVNSITKNIGNLKHGSC